MRVPTYAYRKEFTHIPDHVREALETLSRECAVYTDFWIEEIGDFRHVRIDFTPDEREEFYRRSWSYELFLRADCPTWATDTPGIDAEVAHEADTYSMHLADGTEIPPPNHCFAAFLGEHLERLTCQVTDRVTVIDREGRDLILFEVNRTVQTLTPTIRSFNKREKGLEPWKINCEDDVRDLLYVMLRPRIFDITKEEAIPSKAGGHKFADLCSKAVPFLIELKWIDRKGAWKKKIEEIYVDIQSFSRHPSCETLFLVIVDSIRDIPDPRQLEQELSGVQVVDDRHIEIRAIVCET